jgi:hypothetical protein
MFFWRKLKREKEEKPREKKKFEINSITGFVFFILA